MEKNTDYFAGFVFPITPLGEWAQRYALSLEPLTCPGCDEKLLPVKPMAAKNMRGIIFEPCHCGRCPADRPPFMFRPTDE